MNRSLILLLFPILFANCSDNSEPEVPDPAATITEITESSILFGLNAIKTLSEDPELQNVNLVISPLSIEAALYMTLNGAEGNTESQMANALEFGNIVPNGHNQPFEELVQKLTEENETSTLKIANTVFYDGTGLNPNETFKNLLEIHYNADFTNADFRKASTVNFINDWVKAHTAGKIEKVIENIDSDEFMFLINTLYFKGDWAIGFLENQTSERDFKLSSGNIVKVDMMSSDDYRPVYLGTDYTAVDLPLKDSLFSMTFIQSNDPNEPSDFLNQFDLTELSNFYHNLYDEKLETQRVFLLIPKFETGSKLKLKDMLKKLGMVDAFNELTADFSDLGTGGGNLFLSRVLHDTYLKVDEKGIEGAAVTTVGVAVTSAPPTISFNRPFLFVLRHIETNAIIFIGYIEDPRE